MSLSLRRHGISRRPTCRPLLGAQTPSSSLLAPFLFLSRHCVLRVTQLSLAPVLLLVLLGSMVMQFQSNLRTTSHTSTARFKARVMIRDFQCLRTPRQTRYNFSVLHVFCALAFNLEKYLSFLSTVCTLHSAEHRASHSELVPNVFVLPPCLALLHDKLSLPTFPYSASCMFV